MAPNDYPVDMRIDYADSSSRGWAALTITLIRFLAPLPHAVVLLFLGIAQFFVSLAAQVAVAIKGGYPEGMYRFVTGVICWSIACRASSAPSPTCTRPSPCSRRSPLPKRCQERPCRARSREGGLRLRRRPRRRRRRRLREAERSRSGLACPPQGNAV